MTAVSWLVLYLLILCVLLLGWYTLTSDTEAQREAERRAYEQWRLRQSLERSERIHRIVRGVREGDDDAA